MTIPREYLLSKAKKGLLAIVRELETDRIEVVLTKRGRPVAKIIPLSPDASNASTGKWADNLRELHVVALEAKS